MQPPGSRQGKIFFARVRRDGAVRGCFFSEHCDLLISMALRLSRRALVWLYTMYSNRPQPWLFLLPEGSVASLLEHQPPLDPGDGSLV